VLQEDPTEGKQEEAREEEIKGLLRTENGPLPVLHYVVNGSNTLLFTCPKRKKKGKEEEGVLLTFLCYAKEGEEKQGTSQGWCFFVVRSLYSPLSSSK